PEILMNPPSSAPATTAAPSPKMDSRAFAATSDIRDGSTRGTHAPRSTPYALDRTSAPNAPPYSTNWLPKLAAITQASSARTSDDAGPQAGDRWGVAGEWSGARDRPLDVPRGPSLRGSHRHRPRHGRGGGRRAGGRPPRRPYRGRPRRHALLRGARARVPR